ncbi:hypothetical protein EJ04DRAFT_24441 [Polyplosphaeria fusca]|uniref:Uncharacterized protein n=1 Tax=Polyplosphaeria fusca TaxID=682080 RepID=A0A9P4V6W6_9PLEO|nr:hypothetical protein EJ04DRAFT_24441 [Polyplosphaeria fusca]
MRLRGHRRKVGTLPPILKPTHEQRCLKVDHIPHEYCEKLLCAGGQPIPKCSGSVPIPIPPCDCKDMDYCINFQHFPQESCEQLLCAGGQTVPKCPVKREEQNVGCVEVNITESRARYPNPSSRVNTCTRSATATDTTARRVRFHATSTRASASTTAPRLQTRPHRPRRPRSSSWELTPSLQSTPASLTARSHPNPTTSPIPTPTPTPSPSPSPTPPPILTPTPPHTPTRHSSPSPLPPRSRKSHDVQGCRWARRTPVCAYQKLMRRFSEGKERE